MKRAETISLRCLSEPAFEVVSLGEAKLHSRIDLNDDDSLLATMIAAARQQAENKTRRVLRESVWEWVSRYTGPQAGEIPLAPCSACLELEVDGLKVAEEGRSFSPSGLGAAASPLLASLGFQPDFPGGEIVKATIKAGYAEGACPEAIKQWILIKTASLYEQRESYTVGPNFREFSHCFVDGLLDPFIIP